MAKRIETVRKENALIRNKILKGLRASFKKLVLKNSLEDDELIVSVKGKIKSVKARNIKIS
jgi:RNase P protein component